MDRFANIPPHVLIGLIPALLLEAAMFLALASERYRERISGCCPPLKLAAGLVASAAVPYLVYSLPSQTFLFGSLVWVIGLATLAAFWFIRLPRSPWTDLAFVILMSAVILGGTMKQIYIAPAPKIPADFLGDIMWARMMMASVLLIRRMDGVRLGLMPDRREWGIGVLHYLYFLPIAAVLNYALDFAKPRGGPFDAGKVAIAVIVTFLAHFVFVALREELLFRGVMLRSLQRLTGNPALALAVTSLLAGLGHLPFRQFPNWKFAILATVGHWFYGKAFERAGGVRAGMICHALVNTTWRVFLV